MESYTMVRKSIIIIATILQSVTLTTMAVTFDLGNVNRQLLSDSVHHRSLPQAIGDHRTIRSHNVQTTAAAADRTGKGLPEVQKNYYHNRPSSAAAAVQLQREPKPTLQYGAGSAVSASYLPSPDWTPIAAATPPPLQLKKKLQDAASGNDDVNYPLHRHPDFVTFVTPPPPPSTPMPPTPLQQTAVRENRGNKDLHHLQNDYSTQNNDDGRGTKDNYAVHRGGYNNDNRLQYVVINTAAVGDGGAAEAKKPSYDANDYAHPRQTSYVAGDANPSSDDASSKVQVQFGYVNDEQLETTVAGERHGSRPHGNYMSAAAAVVGEQTAVQLQQPRENYGGVLRQSSSNNLRVDTALNLPEYVQAGADEALTAEGEVLTAAEEGRWDAYVDGNVADPKFDGDAKKGDTGVGDGHATADDGTAVVVRATGWPDDEVAVDDNNDRTPGTDAVDKSKRRGASGGKDTRKGATGGRRIRPYHSNGRTAATAPDNDYGSARAQSDRVHQLDRDEEIGGSRGSSAVAAVVTKSSAVLRQRRRKVQSSPAPSGGLKRRTRPTQVAAVMHREHGDDDYGGLHRSTTTDHGQNGSDELNDHGGYHRRSTMTSSDTSTVASSGRRQTPVVVEDVGTAEGVENTDKGQGQLLGGYGYEYTVLDEHVGMDFGQWERREPGPFGKVTGQYRVRLPDGRTQTVEYSANADTGYRALVTYEGVQHHPAAPSSVARYDSDADETSSD